MWCQRHKQHSQATEVQYCAEYRIEVPENLIHRPIISNHQVVITLAAA